MIGTSLLINILVFFLILGVCFWAVELWVPDAKVKMFARVVLGIVAVIFLLQVLGVVSFVAVR
jgi:hypothetical protein